MRRTIQIVWYCAGGVILIGVGTTFLVVSVYFTVRDKDLKAIVYAPPGAAFLLGGIAGIKGAIEHSKECRLDADDKYFRSKRTRVVMRKQRGGRITPLRYDPAWLVELMHGQFPERLEIIDSLKKCTAAIGFCTCGCDKLYFVDPGSDGWDFKENICLTTRRRYWIHRQLRIVTIMKDNRVGAIETSIQV
jgi:hypothetical protein